MTGTIPAMHMLRSALAGLLALLTAHAAVAQTFPTVPGQSLIGRLGATGDTGPSQAISFARVLSGLGGSQSANRVWAGPTSGGAAAPTFRALVGADLPLPAASTLGGVKSKAAVASNWINSIGTDGGPTQAQPAFSDISGSFTLAQFPTIATLTTLCNVTGGAAVPTACSKTQLTTLINPATAALSGALPAWPNNTTTYFRGDGTYVTLNCAALSGVGNGCSAAAGQLPGTATNDSATAGNVGEFTSSILLVGSAVSLTTATAANVTSVSLTAGDWDVWGTVWTTPGGTTTSTLHKVWIATTSATAPTVPATDSAIAQLWPSTPAGGGNFIPVGPARISISGTTTVFLGTAVTFAVSTMGAFGIIRARRVR